MQMKISTLLGNQSMSTMFFGHHLVITRQSIMCIYGHILSIIHGCTKLTFTRGINASYLFQNDGTPIPS